MTIRLLIADNHELIRAGLRITRAQAERQTLEERLRHLRGRAAKAEGEEFVTLKADIADLECALPDVPVQASEGSLLHFAVNTCADLKSI